MTAHILFIAGAILVPAAGLVAWAWFAWSRIDEELRSIGGFEGMHFDLEPRAVAGRKGAP
jgi:hypothetical protein